MRKRIIIVSHAMELGGAERSLIGLLDAIDPQKYEVDLFLLRHEGELMSHIPDSVNLLPSIPAYTVLARPMKDTLKEGHVLLTVARLLGKFHATQFNRKNGYVESGVELEYSHKYTYWFMPTIQPDVEYDLAISFLTPHYIVANKVRSKKRIAWIHTDYTYVKVDVQSETAMWSAYDRIISISEAVTAGFAKTFPSLQSKLTLIENILPKKLVIEQADEFDAVGEMPQDGAFRLLSIGRYTHQKNFDSIPDICSKICSLGFPVKWYIIGFGGDEELIRQKIREAGMEDTVILLGKKENPYPYIKACDLYVQPSRYEGKSVTVREAQMLGKPVVITNYATSNSQLEDGMDGLIVPLDNNACAEEIALLLADSVKMNALENNCRKRDYSNSSEVEKLYYLLDE